MTLKVDSKKEQIEWRRAKVAQLKARGLNHMEISKELQISRASIIGDVQYLREQAKEAINEYLTEKLPEQYASTLCALDIILKNAYQIFETSHDAGDKLQAMELFKDTHLVKLELLGNAVTIERALNYVKVRQERLQQKEAKEKEEEHCQCQSQSQPESVF